MTVTLPPRSWGSRSLLTRPALVAGRSAAQLFPGHSGQAPRPAEPSPSKPDTRAGRRRRRACALLGSSRYTATVRARATQHTAMGPWPKPGAEVWTRAGSHPATVPAKSAGLRASVELNGAAVVLTVFTLLLRGAHEAAQKVSWKEAHGTVSPQPGPAAAPAPEVPSSHPGVLMGLRGRGWRQCPLRGPAWPPAQARGHR